jgi:hypothetical protein
MLFGAVLLMACAAAARGRGDQRDVTSFSGVPG